MANMGKKTSRSRPALAALLVLSAMMGTWGAAEAWVSTKNWAGSSTGYDRSSMSSNWQSAVGYGAAGWNSVSGSSWYFWVGPSSGNKVSTGYIDGAGGTLASNTSTVSGGIISKFTMKYDTGETWYLGTGSPASGETDARSVTRHEFGHALGLSHTNVSCSGSSRPTMCSGYPTGTTYKRSLETDDKDGLKALYP